MLRVFGICAASRRRSTTEASEPSAKHYRDELDLGSAKATAKVAELLFRKATTEGPQCVTAAIFWMKTRGGWREAPQSHEVAFSRNLNDPTDADLMAIIDPPRLLPRPSK